MAFLFDNLKRLGYYWRMETKPKDPAAVSLGKRGGKSKSEAKIKAARENGKLGGRPKGKKNA